MNKSRKGDQFLYALLAVVFAAAAVIYLKSVGIRPEVEGAKTENPPSNYSASQMLYQLQKTLDDGGAADMKQLENSARGI